MQERKILIIDDDMYMRNAWTRALISEKYDVTDAESGEQGVELISKFQYALVITDLKMPGIGGLEVLKYVKEHSPKTDVIVMTAHGSIENAVVAMKEGAYDYLTKNFDLTELKLIVKRCLEKQELSAEVQELKELVNLYEASKAISSLMGINELLNLILRLVCDTLSADGGSIMLLDPDTNELVVKVALGPRVDSLFGKRISLGERVAGYAAEKEKIINVKGLVNEDSRFSNLNILNEGYKSSLISPLQRKGKLLGVINLHRINNNSNIFNKRDERLLSIFAVEAAIAIENTNLYNTLAIEKEALAHEKEELNATFADMADGAIKADSKMRIIRLNNSAENLLGISQSECVTSYLPDAIADFEPSMPWNEIMSWKERTINFELRRKKGKSLILGALATKIFNQSNNLDGYVIILRDITSDKREARYKLDFLSLISHKLKTPLTTINGFSSVLATSLKNADDKTLNALRAINIQGSLLNDLVDSLLRFTLLESEFTKVSQEKVNIQHMLKLAVEGLVGFILNHNAKVIIDSAVSQLPDINADHLKLVEAVQNLIENAIKFNKSDTKIVKITGRKEGEKNIVIDIIDNGIGIPSEEQSKIFQKFYQIDEYSTGQIKGFGLGLAVVKRIIELHGGEVWVTSKIGEGSTFCIKLPVF